MAWALALGGLLALGSPAAAQVTIEWDAPPPCPTRAAVAAHVARLLAGSTAARTAQPVAVRASVRTLDAGYVLELVTDVGGEHGERRLQAPSCAELAAASAVIVALLVDPAVADAPAASAPASVAASGSAASQAPLQQAEAREASEPTTADPTEAAARPESTAPAEPEEREVQEPAEADEPAEGASIGPALTHVLLRPELVLDIGTLPRPSLGPGVALGVRLGSLSVELSGSYAPRQPVRRAGRTLAELEHAAAALALCYALPPAPLWSPCARVEYGRLWGQGDAVRTPEPGAGALVAAELGLRAQLPLAKSLALSGELGLALPLVAPLFTVDGVRGAIHEPAVLLVRLRAGVEVRL